ncbi:Glyceraldehyde-3-phosphate dehydrogenase [Galemys pyrenaicus]|uniref:Glyceraldehyde-3-phosphate dehydrogenase n=1 Tax=Galemys pyrenaicus TaxID=202257 RepID=A0A8J6DWL9_GALPY|nr:Glyceraldehyde-3-phosphate dehydrogenase [Galemys pyrenaicus]
MTIVRAIIVTQKTMNDPSEKLWHAGCRATQNITPTCPDTTMAVGKATPELKKTLKSAVVAVPCPLKKTVKYDDVKVVMKQGSKGPLKGILGYSEDQVVSCDF